MTDAHATPSAIAQPPRAGRRFMRRSIARRRIARTVLAYAGLLMLAIIVVHLSRRATGTSAIGSVLCAASAAGSQ
jgi:hypothetical protein